MNFYSDRVESFAKSLDSFVLGYFLSPNFDCTSGFISFNSTFDLNVLKVLSDSSCSDSPEQFNKPYAVNGRIAVIGAYNNAVIDSSFSKDMGDYIMITGVFNGITSVIIMGVCNSTLTDAYTPFKLIEGVPDINVSYYELSEILALGKSPRDPFSNAVISGNISIGHNMPNLSFNPNYNAEQNAINRILNSPIRQMPNFHI